MTEEAIVNEAAEVAATPDPTLDTNATPTPTPDPSPTPDPNDWKSSLSEDLRADPALQDIKDVESLAKSMVHAQKLVGMDKQQLVAIPGEDADEAVLEEFYQKTGRPATADDYQLPTDKLELPEGVQRNEDMEKWYKEAAHKYGISQKAAAGLYQEYMQFAGQAVEGQSIQLEQLRDRGVAELKKEWGAAYETRMKQAVAPLRQFADAEFVEFLDQTGLGSHPEMARFLQKIATNMGEDGLSDPSKSESVMSPSEATAEIARKFNDKQFMEAYRGGDHPSHKWAVDEMSKLYKYQTAGS